MKKRIGSVLVIGMLAVLALMTGTGFTTNQQTASDKWTAKYWNNTNMSGSPVLERQEATIDHNWGGGSPDAVVNRNGFSARWTRVVYFNEGTYRFRVQADDGVRLWVDDQLIVNRWVDQPAHAHTADLKLSTGLHEIEMEYYENTDQAVAKLSWSQVFTAWKGEYFANRSLSGTPALVRDDPVIDFNWGLGRPATGVGLNRDDFSARWTRTIATGNATYRFTVTADDGMRLYIDDRLVIDRWTESPAQTHTADVTLQSGNHAVRLEYFEATENASVRLDWTVVQQTPSTTTGSQRMLEATTVVNVRSGAGVSNPRIGIITPGTKYTIQSEQNGWYAILFRGQTGWVSANWVRVTNTTPLPYINYRADRQVIRRGECTTITWDVGGIRAVYFNNQGVVGQGSQFVCPTSTTTYYLDVTHTDGRIERRPLTITVQ